MEGKNSTDLKFSAPRFSPRASRGNGVYTTANEKYVSRIFRKYINITRSTFPAINSNFAITRLVCLHTIIHTARVERRY